MKDKPTIQMHMNKIIGNRIDKPTTLQIYEDIQKELNNLYDYITDSLNIKIFINDAPFVGWRFGLARKTAVPLVSINGKAKDFWATTNDAATMLLSLYTTPISELSRNTPLYLYT